MKYKNLINYGLSDRFEQESTLYEGMFLGRVVQQNRDLYRVVCENGELSAGVSGKLIYNANDSDSFPAVGDWVMTDREDGSHGNAVIHAILRRKSVFSRMAAGTSKSVQIIAANVDTIFICMSLNADFNLRRMERYLTIAWDSGASPVIVLTKSDLCEDLERSIREISSVSAGADAVVCSAMSDDGYRSVSDYVTAGKTIAFIGSSGVGKSTLINRLSGEDRLAVNAIREDDGKGRHTTTRRELLLLPNGGIVIDTPGMRELQIYTGGISKAFEDIEELAAECKYSDCNHVSEPGCMVQKAIKDGLLSEKRLESFRKLQNEISYDGLNSRQVEQQKLNRMFGGKGDYKKAMKDIKAKAKR